MITLTILNLLWLSTTILAWLFIRKRQIEVHRQFMVRSYICGLAFVFIRVLDKISGATGLFDFIKDEETRATLIDSLGWIIPVMITEFFLIWWPAIKKLGKPKVEATP